MRLVLVRHAEPDWPEGWVDADVGLTERGRRQAKAVEGELSLRVTTLGPFIAVVSSPAQRALETAEVIARHLGDLPLTTDDGLMGLSEGELRRKVSLGEFDDEVMAKVAQIGEAAWVTAERLMEGTDPAATVVAVSHDLTIAALVCRALATPVSDFRRMRIDPASFTVLDLRPNRFRLLLLNETHHLDEPVKA